MPIVSKRGSRMIHSPIRSLIPYARAAKDKGVKVYHLNIGQPDIRTPRPALEALKSYDHQIIEYGASEGYLPLRQEVCEYYNRHVATVDLEDIFVTTGASEAIMFSLFSCFDEEAEIIIPEPFYANYIGFSQISDITLVPVTSHIESGFGLPDTEDIKSKITSKTKGIFLCNPSNPTGNLYTKEELHAIADIVQKYDLFLIVDEVYREFTYDQDFYSVLKIDAIADQVIVIDSISKVFSACGSRIGYIVTRNDEVKSNILKYAQLRLCPPMIGQHMAVACYEDREEYLSEVRSEYERRRDYLYKRLSAMPGVTCYLPKAAFYIMTELPIDDANHFCKWLLSDYEQEGKTIMMAPGQGFYLSPDTGKSQVRIAFVLDVESLTIAMDILEHALIKYQEVSIPVRSALA